MKKLVVIIDAQNDFTHPKGSLNVDPEGKVVDNICKFLKKISKESPEDNIDLLLTMDAHPENHISFCEHWMSNEIPVKPFTDITLSSLKNFDNLTKEDKKFIKKVKKFTVYPRHCVDGDWGYCINSKIVEVLKDFTHDSMEYEVSIEKKGEDPYNDAYSILSTIDGRFLNKNEELLKKIEQYNEIYVCGFCLDICVSHFLRDICRYSPETLKRAGVIINCTAPSNKDFEYYNDIHYQYMCLKGLSTIDIDFSRDSFDK